MGKPVSKYALPNDLIRVYKHDQQPGLNTEPYGYVTREYANWVVRDLEFARFCVKGFAIWMKPDPEKRVKKWAEVTIRGTSAQMGPRVTENAVFGEGAAMHLAKEAALSYLMTFAGSYCPLVAKSA